MDKDIQPIGLQVRHLQPNDELRTAVTGLQKLPLTKMLSDQAFTTIKARQYLDINCSHCHNEKGPANTSGLHLEAHIPLSNEVGVCKRPIAAGTGTGGNQYDIVPGHADKSIFSYRMASDNPASMMPELGRSLVHEEGVELINAWIESLDGDCT